MTSTLARTANTLELPEAVLAAPHDFRVLTGDRPTGTLHVGHYFGSLQNRVRLQNQGVDMFVLVADYQVITDRDVADDVAAHVEGLVLDYLAVGLTPERSTIFAHSAVPALNQLLLPFLSLVSVAELQRNPTVKEEIAASGRRAVSGLMLTYPVHQAADILSCHANLVPVGEDQLPHLEVARTVARRFNARYGPLFAEPRALLSQAPRLLGADARKMGKSSGNSIPLAADADETARLLKAAVTDAEPRVQYDPDSRPGVSNLLLLTALCTGRDPHEVAEEIGDRGAATLKRLATEAVNEYFAPIRRRRREFAADPAQVRQILRDGAARVNETADATLRQVRRAMGAPM
ncbi:MAG: tryptophan--tRNA ligase [Stackebrandtia sp.]